MDCGIYIIRNLLNGKNYIGSSNNIPLRFNQHRSSLRGGKHHSFILQRAWNKYGETSFSFEIVAFCPEEYLIKLEQHFIDSLKPLYNISKVAGKSVEHHSIESKAKISRSKLGKPNPSSTGEKHHNSKLTWDKVFQIRNKYKLGISQYDLAIEFKVGQDNISRIVNNKIWQIVH